MSTSNESQPAPSKVMQQAEKNCGVCADPETQSQMKGLLENSDGIYRLPKTRKITVEKPKIWTKIKNLYSSKEITPTGQHLGNYTDVTSTRASRRWIVNRASKSVPPKGHHIPYALRYSKSEKAEMASFFDKENMNVTEMEIAYRIPHKPAERERELGTDTENNVKIILHDDGSISPLHCPTTYKELSQSTWQYLHTMAAYYPEQPDETFKINTLAFLKQFALLYPCHHCKDHMVKYIDKNPVQLDSNEDFSVWMCEYHNNVNAWLGKRIVTCNPTYLIHRYKDGYPAGAGVDCTSDL